MKINNVKKNNKRNTYFKYKVLAVVFVSLIVLGVYAVREVSNMVAERDSAIYNDGWEAGNLIGLEDGYNAAKEEDWALLNSNPEMVKLLKKYFPEWEEARTAAAIIQAESKFKPDAKNYNCYYTNKAGKKYSTQCKKGDEHKAWSVDCGVAQLNYHGKICPAWTLDPELNIKKMSDMYSKRGWSPWVTYNKGLHIAHMK